MSMEHTESSIFRKRGCMAELMEKPAEGRKGDGVLLLMQDNTKRALTINAANETLTNLLGYAAGDLTDHTLDEILGVRTAKLLSEELEYRDDAPDFGDIFSRQHTVRMRHRLGEEIALPCTVLRIMAEDRNPRFQMVLPDEHEKLAKQQLRDFLKTSLDGRLEVDPITGLPNRETTENYLKLLKSYRATNTVSVSFAVLRLDRHNRSMERYDADGCNALLKHVANCCRSTFRTEDVIGVLSESTLALVLFDISRESARVVLNRLRGNVREHRLAFGGKADFSVTISVAFDMMGDIDNADLLSNCEAAMEELDNDERSILIELGN